MPLSPLRFRWPALAALGLAIAAAFAVLAPRVAIAAAPVTGSTPATRPDVQISGPAAPLAPVPKDRPLTLRVLYLEHPQLPAVTQAQRQELYGKVQRLLASWLGHQATLREVGQQDFAGYIASRELAWRQHAPMIAGDLDLAATAQRERLRAQIRQTIAAQGRITPAATGEPPSIEAATNTLYDRFLDRVAQIRALPLPGGGTLGESLPYTHSGYLHWCALTYEMSDADIVVSNAMILGADAEMDAGIIARGGVTFGSTNGNRHNALASAMYIPLYPIFSEEPFWVRERGAIPPAERLDVAATLFLHELGHMLLRLKHPADHGPGCVHAPAPLLRLYVWHQAVRAAGPCPLPHERVVSY